MAATGRMPAVRRAAIVAAGIAAIVVALSACGGNVMTRWSTTWVDIRPNPTPIDTATAECRAEADRPDAHDDALHFCMQRHGWVAMSDPLLK